MFEEIKKNVIQLLNNKDLETVDIRFTNNLHEGSKDETSIEIILKPRGNNESKNI